MEFKKVSIGDYSYGLDEGLTGKADEPELEKDWDGELLPEVDHLSSQESSRAGNESLPNFNFYDPEFNEHLKDSNHPNHKNIVNFLQHLALCHTIVI